MSILFQTINHSTYEIDFLQSRIRRLTGAASPTQRQGEDGNWRKYLKISSPKIGQPLLIVWEIAKNNENVIYRSTSTSPVLKFLTADDFN